MIGFAELVQKQRAESFVPVRLLAIDPGDTTGFAVFEGTDLVQWGEVEGNHVVMHKLFTGVEPTAVCCEEYRIYATHANEHIHSDVPTLRLIGGIEMLCHLADLPIAKVGAGQVKAFSTDEKLKAWDLYQPTYRHANDAIRHGVFHLIFGDD